MDRLGLDCSDLGRRFGTNRRTLRSEWCTVRSSLLPHRHWIETGEILKLQEVETDPLSTSSWARKPEWAASAGWQPVLDGCRRSLNPRGP